MIKNSVAIIGLGYVGLPLAILLKKKKFKIFGFDSNIEVIKKLTQGNLISLIFQIKKFLN